MTKCNIKQSRYFANNFPKTKWFHFSNTWVFLAVDDLSHLHQQPRNIDWLFRFGCFRWLRLLLLLFFLGLVLFLVFVLWLFLLFGLLWLLFLGRFFFLWGFFFGRSFLRWFRKSDLRLSVSKLKGCQFRFQSFDLFSEPIVKKGDDDKPTWAGSSPASRSSPEC